MAAGEVPGWAWQPVERSHARRPERPQRELRACTSRCLVSSSMSLDSQCLRLKRNDAMSSAPPQFAVVDLRWAWIWA
jgi:hypothetical protein